MPARHGHQHESPVPPAPPPRQPHRGPSPLSPSGFPRRRPHHRVCLTLTALLTATVLAVVIGAETASAAPGGAMLAVKTLPQVVDSATKWVVGILGAVATFFLTLGGARYLMAGGDPGEVEKAKEAFRSAGKGYALAVLAPVILQVLKGILGA